jgi:regulator of sirC expression with transglutaminase-like and TPR domain
MSHRIKKRFARELAKEDNEINLAYGALLFSQYLTGAFKPARYLHLLDDLAGPVRADVLAAETDMARIQVLNHHLFQHLGFTGNSQDYYHPDNSLLNKVLERWTGIPISLSVIYLEVGWRLELPVWGIGMPRHFIVGYGTPEDPIYIDVFNGGRILSEDDCLALARVPRVHRRSFVRQFLRPVSKRTILFRMLLNLKQIYMANENWPAAYDTIDLLLVVRPDQFNELKDRGLIAYRLGRLQSAIFDLNRYLFLAPNPTDKEWLTKRVKLMEEELLRLN